MANKRLYIRCAVCGERLLVAKSFGEPYGIYWPDFDERLNAFFERHYQCEHYEIGKNYEIFEDD